MLHGKGVFIWEVQKCEGGNPSQIVQVARDAGLIHLAVKIADGAYSFPDSPYEESTVAAIAALKAAGFVVWGWQFVYGRNRHNLSQRIAQEEADIAIRRVRDLGLSGFIIDFESSGTAWTYYGDTQDARVYMDRLRAGLPDIPLAAASHRFPHLHPHLPWEEFMSRCDLAMPQVYWVAGDPVWNLQASWQEYQARWPRLPYIPIGAAYGEGYKNRAGEDKYWSVSPDEITRFMQKAHELDLPAVSFWSWQNARHDSRNRVWPGTELWDAIAAFPWSAPIPPEHVSERAVWVTAQAGLKFRSKNSTDDAYWINGIVFSTGTALTALGDPTPVDAQTYRFQRVRAPNRWEGWVTYSIGGEVYLTEEEMFSAPPSGSPEKAVRVTALWGLKFRHKALNDDAYWIDGIIFPTGASLTAIGDPTPMDPQTYRWQYVRAPDGREGWVTYSIGSNVYLAEEETFPVPPPGSPEKTVQVTASLGLKFRRKTSLDDAYWIDRILFPTGARLTAIGDPTPVDSLSYRWQYVRALDGRTGWVTYSISDEAYLMDYVTPQQPVDILWTTTPLHVYSAPSGQSSPVWAVADDVPLTVLEDAATAGTKVGVGGQWIHVRTPGLKEGYVAADLVRAGQLPDTRQPVDQVPPGESPFIFGFHDSSDRGIFAGSGKTGWIILTEEIGSDPETARGNRDAYYDWSRAGFGIIVRLNHGYDSRGTLPDPSRYADFAATCKRWVQQSINSTDPQHGCHIWIIGNEMNNPREWLGNQGGVGGLPITPEGYAACFNQVYAAIKAVQPGAIVCPGAVDPYNAVAGDCKEWFNRMLARITDLDGIALHTYTHGDEPHLITSRATFGDVPLTWQYYNFYAYRTFMDLIPGRWREVSVFITETNQNDPWTDANNGWVQRAYEEIERWNQAAHHQQIRCLLLYRWWQVDPWSIEGKTQVIEDFKAALQHDYRWRR